jgi:hypothetical protein
MNGSVARSPPTPGRPALGVVLVPLGAVGIVLALAGAILAAPYLLVRRLRRRGHTNASPVVMEVRAATRPT